MEALLIPLTFFVFLAFPVWVLVLLHKILHRQDHQFSLLNSLHLRLDRLAAGEKKPESAPAPMPRPAPAPVAPPPAPVPPVAAPPSPAPVFARSHRSKQPVDQRS